MAAAATARKAEVAPARRRVQPRSAPRAPAPRARAASQAARLVRAGDGGRRAVSLSRRSQRGAVRDISDSSLIMRLPGAQLDRRPRSDAHRDSAQRDQPQPDLRIGPVFAADRRAERARSPGCTRDRRGLSAERVEGEASRLGLAVPDPKAITYLTPATATPRGSRHLPWHRQLLLAPTSHRAIRRRGPRMRR